MSESAFCQLRDTLLMIDVTGNF